MSVLRLRLACPKCGGPFDADDETHSLKCAHCGSLLLLEASEREELYVAEGTVHSREQLADTLVRYRVAAHRAEIIDRYKDDDGNPPSEMWIENRLAAYERKLRDVVHVVDAQLIHVPYWHITGSIVHGILGRAQGDIKTTRVRAFGVQHSVPGYDTDRANLRDVGLRLAETLAQPLTLAAVQAKGQFLPRVALQEQQHREIDKWVTRDLDRRVDPIAKHGAFLGERRLLVYRPYWLAVVKTDRGDESLLFDASFDTIAGYPSPEERRALLRLRDPDPLRATQPSFRRVHVVPPRCPDCGFEQMLDRRAVLSLCPNCHLALELTPTGARIVPYEHAGRGAPDLDAAYLPFWRFAMRLELQDKRRLESLEQYGQALFSQPPPGFTARGRHVFVPGFRLLGTEPGDACFKEISEWIHAEPLDRHGGKIPLGGRPRFVPASVPEAAARALAPFALVALHGKGSAARLNAMQFRKTTCDARLTLDEPTLVMVPFARDGEDVFVPQRPGVRVGALLLGDSPELRQMQRTVQGAAASAGAD